MPAVKSPQEISDTVLQTGDAVGVFVLGVGGEGKLDLDEPWKTRARDKKSAPEPGLRLPPWRTLGESDTRGRGITIGEFKYIVSKIMLFIILYRLNREE